MFEAWLGPDRFQAGVRRYLQRHAWGSATGADFFNALAVEDPALPDAIRSFTRQAGIPLVSATLRCDGGPPRLQLAQSRLLPLGSPAASGPAQHWQIPLLLRSPAGNSRWLLTEAEATVPLPDNDCPTWVMANAGGAGYYRTAYAGLEVDRLAAAPGLTVGERLVLLDDASGLHDAGRIGSVQALALVQSLAADPSREVVEAAMALLLHLRPLVTPDQQPAWADRWQALFGQRARALGWAARPGDSDDDRLLRITLLPAVARHGEDVALRDQALQAAQSWLVDHRALAVDLRAPVLTTAALAGLGQPGGDDGAMALFDALLTALRQSTDRNERDDLLAALGSFRQPALARRALALLLDADIDIRDSLQPVLRSQAATPEGRAEALAFVAQRHADIAKRQGRDEPAWLPLNFEGGCGADEARRIQAAFAPHAARYQGGQLALKRTLEAVTLCGAWQAQQTSGL
jgi:alanyl aminopeptidase